MYPDELPATALATAIAAGELSSTEAVDACLARIEAVQPTLNAIVAERYEQARAEAREADRRRAAGAEVGPLDGLPVTVKESLDLAGLPSTGGFTGRAGHRASADEPHVARWRAAGAIVLGKTNVAQGLAFIETDNPLYGRTNNPWDPDRSCGGSSGGEGAIIAAGGSALGLGTDIGGSVRFPAAFCGIAGFKPTAGRLPDEGRLSFHPGQRTVQSQVGVLGREVADVVLGLRAAESPDGPAPLGDPATVDLAGLRVGWFASDGVFPAAPTAVRALAGAVRALRDAGATVEEFAPIAPEECGALEITMLGADGLAWIRELLGDGPADPRVTQLVELLALSDAQLDGVQESILATGDAAAARALDIFRFGRSAADHLLAVDRVIAYRERWRSALAAAGLDLLLSPATPLPALNHGASADLATLGSTMILYNILGYPAGVVPWTRVRPDETAPGRPEEPARVRRMWRVLDGGAGLPMGVQVAARPWRDHHALAAMAVIEAAARKTGEHPGRPPR